MLDLRTAKEKVEQYVNSIYHSENDQLVVLDELTIEKPYGWVFFYDSLRHQQTGDDQYRIAGNAPIVIEKADGTLSPLGTALPFEQYLEDYESQKHPKQS